MYKEVEVAICKCKYCGSYAVIINDIGKCPKGCPGYFTVIATVPGLIEEPPNKIDTPDADYLCPEDDLSYSHDYKRCHSRR